MGDVELGPEPETPGAQDPPGICVLVVDGEAMVAGALAAACDREHDLEVVGTAGTVADAERLVGRTRPHVAVVDDGLPDGDPAEVVGRMRSVHPSVRVVVLGRATDDRTFHRAMQERIEGYLLRQQDVAQLVDGIRMVAAGGTAYAPDVMNRLVARMTGTGPANPQHLSEREVEVLQRLANGAGTPEVADAMHISVNTVRNHVQHALRKLGAHSRLEAVAVAMRTGIVEAP
jgi:DNA-binding NarL/FixJ family response regulator